MFCILCVTLKSNILVLEFELNMKPEMCLHPIFLVLVVNIHALSNGSRVINGPCWTDVPVHTIRVAPVAKESTCSLRGAAILFKSFEERNTSSWALKILAFTNLETMTFRITLQIYFHLCHEVYFECMMFFLQLTIFVLVIVRVHFSWVSSRLRRQFNLARSAKNVL